MPLPEAWMPRPCADLVRWGAPNDGGYVIPRPAVLACDTLVSMGLSTDWSFEAAFHDARGGAVVAYDHTVTWDKWVQAIAAHTYKRRFGHLLDVVRFRRFFARPGVEHRRLAVGYDMPGSRTFIQIMAEVPADRRVGLKVDIEGWEYRILDQIVELRERLEFMTVEFHEIDLMRPRIEAFVEQMTGFGVVWVHGNNLGGVDGDGDPLVIEMTLVPDRYLGAGEGPAASALTTPNNVEFPEIEVTFRSSDSATS